MKRDWTSKIDKLGRLTSVYAFFSFDRCHVHNNISHSMFCSPWHQTVALSLCLRVAPLFLKTKPKGNSCCSPNTWRWLWLLRIFFLKKEKKQELDLKVWNQPFFIMFFKSYCLPLEDNFLFYVFQINQELCFFFLWKQKYLGNGDSLVVSYNSVQNVTFVISRSNLLFNLGFKLNSVRTILRWLSPLHMSKSYLNDRQKHGLTLKKSNW